MKRIILVLVAGFGVSVGAAQSLLPKVGVTVKEIQTWATQAVMASTDVEGGYARYVVPCVPSGALNAIQSMTPAERLALTQEVLAAVKAAVLTQEFKAEHAAYVKRTRNAVDHGIADTLKFGMTGNGEPDMIKAVIVPIIDMLRGAPIDGLKEAYENDRNDQRESIKNETGEERAKAQKYLARLDALAPLLKTNPEQFRRQYTLAKSASMGGPDTESQLQAMTASREDMEKLRVEQNQWNHWNLNEMIRKDLEQYVAVASTIKPGGEYVCDNQSHNANYNKASLDALMQLMGAGPINAGVQFARAWLKELPARAR